VLTRKSRSLLKFLVLYFTSMFVLHKTGAFCTVFHRRVKDAINYLVILSLYIIVLL